MNTRLQEKKCGFTLVELAVVLAVIGLLGCTLLPALAKGRPNTQAAQCMNNMRQLAAMFKMSADDNADVLVSADDGMTGRTYWLDSYNSYSLNSSLQPYVSKSPGILRCPADQSTQQARCVSMNSAFGNGVWLRGGSGYSGPSWRLYAKGVDIVTPAKTFVFADEHPNSINDGALCNVCTGNEPSDPPGLSMIIDWPASYHDGAGSFCFADGRAEIHKWVGSTMNAQIGVSLAQYGISAGDSWPDMHWLAENTTVKR
jgi:prepilin-type N-terminal cleavage/methylation domain-containing protein